MKTRNGFVSNSSSSSFLVLKSKSLDFGDNAEVLDKLAHMENDYDYDVTGADIQKCLVSAVEDARELTVKSTTLELTYDNFENAIKRMSFNVNASSKKNELLKKFVESFKKLPERSLFSLTIDTYNNAKTDWTVIDHVRDVIIGTLVARMISDFEAEHGVEVLVMKFASDNGSSEEALLKYNGLPDVDGVEWVTLSEG